MTTELQTIHPASARGESPAPAVPFGVNELRLNARNWLVCLCLLLGIMWLVPAAWKRFERFPTGPDYRTPYDLSRDYWLYARRLEKIQNPSSVVLLGDSVIWGEYVLPDGTLSHFLNQQAGATDKFINGGLNGLFPLAEQGLVTHYSKPLHGKKVLLECNLLWMTSPKADLSSEKEDVFNHSRLVPQFWPRIPCYKANANERLSAWFENHIQFFSWIGHLQNAYFDQKSIPNWTLEDNGGTPPRYPNSYKNPFSQISLTVPSAPAADPQRGPGSSRHRPWNSSGQEPTRFDWVPQERSLQWRGFQEVVKELEARGNEVLVLVGPFNEHMIAEDNRPGFRQLHDGIIAWLRDHAVAVVSPEALPSEVYADASHPLTKGYELLARELYANKTFQEWLKK